MRGKDDDRNCAAGQIATIRHEIEAGILAWSDVGHHEVNINAFEQARAFSMLSADITSAMALSLPPTRSSTSWSSSK
ncbi:hypothetical protein LQG66_17475 [Bradyrhizobium ontarionense]|uniref:Uncharacterized protein n=1 Tax=Bradyrhizobium ontarionense TaxID=2898149 RepID=A0ABY3RKW4_9BRAD|nr:hypothetical protein [Bradyrhizobium sp. A19]UFZ07978.1 hypothetical protein LQG66_17475 [Bradyrhizobium sp. A19]